MTVFIDTSGFLAVLNRDDRFHGSAKQNWIDLMVSNVTLFTSNYVLLETTALLQNRFGIEAIRLFLSDIQPVLQCVWVDEVVHSVGLRVVISANRRNLSLVDCTSFEIMRLNHIEQVFTFDQHFSEQGFLRVPQISIQNEL